VICCALRGKGIYFRVNHCEGYYGTQRFKVGYDPREKRFR
jgi:hypothetical protein